MRSVLGWLALAVVLTVICVAGMLLFRGQAVTDAAGAERVSASPADPMADSDRVIESPRSAPDREPIEGGVSEPAARGAASIATLIVRLTATDTTLRGPYELALAPVGRGAERARMVEVESSSTFVGLEPGGYRIQVREPRPEAPKDARGWSSWFSTPVPVGATVAERLVELPAGETELDIVLGRAPLESCRLSGWIAECGSSDAPVRYRVEYVIPSDFERAVDVEPDGAFDLGLVSPGVGNLIVSCRVGHTKNWSPLQVERLEVAAGEERSLELQAPCFAVISAHVVALGTEAVLGDAVVQISSEADDLGSVGITLSGAGKTGILPEGTYWAAATAEGHRMSLQPFEVGSDGRDVVLAFELARADDWIVQLVDRAGRPIAGARVSIAEQDGLSIPRAIQPTATTDDLGNLAAGFLEPRRYGVRIAYGDFLYESTLALDMGTPVLVIEEIDAGPSGATKPR